MSVVCAVGEEGGAETKHFTDTVGQLCKSEKIESKL